MRHDRGLTLVEVLVAMAILLMGAVSLTGLQMQLLRSLCSSQQHAEAMRLAQGKLEELRGFQTLQRQVGAFAYQDIGNDRGGERPAGWHSGGRLQLNWISQDGPSLASLGNLPAYKRVDVQALWLDGRQQWQRLVLTGIITPYPQVARWQLQQE